MVFPIKMDEKYRYIEFEFDSLDAQTSINATVASTDWPLFRLPRPLSNIAAMKILEVQIPFSYYVIDTKNNTIFDVLHYSIGDNNAGSIKHKSYIAS